MNTLKAKVKGGRLILDEPTTLPEGTEVELCLADPGDVFCGFCKRVYQGARRIERMESHFVTGAAQLKAAGIIPLEKDMRLMTRAELVLHFASKRSGRVVLAKLFKSLVWQVYENIQAGKAHSLLPREYQLGVQGVPFVQPRPVSLHPWV